MEKILPQEAIKVAIKKLINRVFGVESPKKTSIKTTLLISLLLAGSAKINRLAEKI